MFQSLRHNMPLAYTALKVFFIGLAAASAVFVVFTVGTTLSPKLAAFSEAVHWSTRAFLYDGHKNTDVRPARHFTAEILGMTKDAHVVFKMATPDGYQKVVAEFADLLITDVVNTTMMINRYKGRTLYVDYYQYELDGTVHDCVVLWDEFSTPLNLELVQRQFAKPVETPPTNIVNTLMASYYWRKVKE